MPSFQGNSCWPGQAMHLEGESSTLGGHRILRPRDRHPYQDDLGFHGVPDEEGDGFSRWISAGLTDAEIDAIGPLPRTHGLLGAALYDPEPFRKATGIYAPHVIRLALDRVRKAQTIQKSRTALFRYLLPRIAKEASARR